MGGKVSIFMGLMVIVWGIQSSEASGIFGFDIHHRYSDPVKSILDLDGLPEKYTLNYYAAMAHRDHFIRRRRLADTTTPVSFIDGNDTLRINSLGLYVFLFFLFFI